MATSAQQAGRSWSNPDPELLAQEPLTYAEPAPLVSTASPAVEAEDDLPPDVAEVSIGEYVAMPGLPARGVVLVSVLAAAGCAGADLLLTSTITMFFDLCFIVVCLVSAMAVRRRDFFTTGVLPPLLFAVVIAAVAVHDPGSFVHTGGALKAFMTGLADHATALVVGYAVVLATLCGRVSAARSR